MSFSSESEANNKSANAKHALNENPEKGDWSRAEGSVWCLIGTETTSVLASHSSGPVGTSSLLHPEPLSYDLLATSPLAALKTCIAQDFDHTQNSSAKKTQNASPVTVEASDTKITHFSWEEFPNALHQQSLTPVLSVIPWKAQQIFWPSEEFRQELQWHVPGELSFHASKNLPTFLWNSYGIGKREFYIRRLKRVCNNLGTSAIIRSRET